MRALAVRLDEEMSTRWKAGDPVRAEDFLNRFPELSNQPDDFARLLQHEMALRRQAGERPDPPARPVREASDEFRVLATIAEGGEGRVLLATQPALADRPVVLKITSCRGKEHLALGLGGCRQVHLQYGEGKQRTDPAHPIPPSDRPKPQAVGG